MHFAIDPGSCHLNKKEYVEEFVKRGIDSGASSIKFQLFTEDSIHNRNGNIALSKQNFEHAFNLAPTQVTASVFDDESLEFLLSFNPSYVKFAFSKRASYLWMQMCHELDIPVVVTATIWDTFSIPITKLITAYHDDKTLYPNPYLMDFSGLFPEHFQGYSDHSIGWQSAYGAKVAGANWIEKHMKLPNKLDVKCPDAVFASDDWSKLVHFK